MIESDLLARIVVQHTKQLQNVGVVRRELIRRPIAANTHRAEAWKMSAVNDGDGQAAQRLKRLDIGVRVRMVSIVDQRAAIDDVAGEEDTRRPLEQADTTRRVSGGVDDLETTIAEVDYIVLGERRWAGAGQGTKSLRSSPLRGAASGEAGDNSRSQ